jgi:catechol 2,3-dioxygenase-like lactoylglutathione lyase family enzyme
MAITLNHTIVPAHDKEASAKFFAHMFGLKYEGAMSHFAPVRINETLTLDFDTWDRFEMHHYAFHVSDAEFDAIFGRNQGGRNPLRQRSNVARGHEDQYLERRPRRLFQRSQRPRAGASHASLIARVTAKLRMRRMVHAAC